MYAGSERGERYMTILAHGGEGDHGTPGVWERTIGDLIDPSRPGSIMAVVNSVSREVGRDVQGWRVDRLVSMYAGLVQESRERQRAE